MIMILIVFSDIMNRNAKSKYIMLYQYIKVNVSTVEGCHTFVFGKFIEKMRNKLYS